MSAEKRFVGRPLRVAVSASLWRNLMRNELSRTSAICALLVAGLAATAIAQAPAQGGAAASPNANIVVENPTYTTVGPLTITVNRPVAEVWKRIGPYCAIGEWAQIPGGCKMLSGNEGDVGAVRSVATEIMVAKTEYSHTPNRSGRGVRTTCTTARSRRGLRHRRPRRSTTR
jgi:hypothetical protein